MLKFLRELDRSAIAVFIFSLAFFSLLYSKWLLSVSQFSILGLALINIILLLTHPKASNKLADSFSRFYKKHPPYWALSLVFLVVLFSGILGISDYWFSRLRIKLPFILVPLAFAFLSPLSKKYYRSWIYIFIAITCTSLIMVLGNYLFHFEEIQQLISRGGSIPTPVAHIRYSLFIAFAMIMSFWLFLDSSVPKKYKEDWLGLLVGILLFIGLHFLSVRSGLLSAYIGIFACLIYWVVTQKKWLVGILIFAIVLIAPFIAYKNVPSFQSKVSYTLHDLGMYKKGEGNAYSDSDRLSSFRVGWELFKAHPILGTGVGNFKEAVKEEYAKHYPDNTGSKMPHNQFLSILASTGIIGLLISLFGMLAPLVYNKNYRYLPLTCFYLMIFSSMMVENTLETSVGLALFMLPILIMNNFLLGQKSAG